MMATASLLPLPRFVAFDSNGNPLSGGLVTTQVAGGGPLKTTYQDAGEAIPNSNPIVLDADGSALIYADGSVQIITTDALGNPIPAYSGLSSAFLQDGTFALVTDLRANGLAVTSPAEVEVVGYYAPGDGGAGEFIYVPTDHSSPDNGGTVIVDALGQRWHRETMGLPLDPLWFGAHGDGANDDTAAFQATFDAAVNDPRAIWAPGVTSSYILASATLGSVNFESASYRVNTTLADPYANIDQSKLPAAPVYTQTGAERFGYSVRNSNVTAYQIYSSIGTTAFMDVLQSVAHMQPGTPGTLNQMTAVAGYIKDQAGQVGGNVNGVALFGAGTGETDGSAVWGINTLLQDNSARVIAGGGGQLLNEFDFNVMKAGTFVNGLLLQGSSLSQPVSATAIGVGQLAAGAPGTIKWTTGVLFADGATTNAMGIGLRNFSVVANDKSQPIVFIGRDSASAVQTVNLFLEGASIGSNMSVTLESAAPVQLQIGGPAPIGLLVGANKVVGQRIGGWGTLRGGVRAQLDPATGTLTQTIDALNALIADLFTHGMIGP